MKLLYTKIILILSIASLISGISNAQTTTCTIALSPTDDAYTNSTPIRRGSNFGTASVLSVNEWTWSGVPGTERSYLNFDLSTIPQNATIASASLKLYAHSSNWTNATSPNASTIRNVTTAWSEGALTFNNAPQVGNLTAAIAASATNASVDVSTNVTAMVQNMVNNPSSAYGFRVENNNPGVTFASYRWASKEFLDPSKRPVLVIEVTYPNNPDIALSTPNTSMCQGESINLSSSVNGGMWSIPNNSNQNTITQNGAFSGNTPGLETVEYTVVDANGCTAKASIELKVGVLPFEIIGPDNLCEYSSQVTYYVNEQAIGNVYYWQVFGNNTANVNYPSNGKSIGFTARSVPTGNSTVISAQGKFSCIAGNELITTVEKPVTINPRPANPNITVDENLDNLSVSNAGSSSIIWKDKDDNVIGTGNSVVNPRNGVVKVEYTNIYGCKTNSSWYGIQNCTYDYGAIAARKAFVENNTTHLYPNPASSIIYFETSGQKGMAKVYNTTAQFIEEIELLEGKLGYNISVEDYNPGVYVLNITENGSASSSSAFVVE